MPFLCLSAPASVDQSSADRIAVSISSSGESSSQPSSSSMCTDLAPPLGVQTIWKRPAVPSTRQASVLAGSLQRPAKARMQDQVIPSAGAGVQGDATGWEAKEVPALQRNAKLLAKCRWVRDCRYRNLDTIKPKTTISTRRRTTRTRYICCRLGRRSNQRDHRSCILISGVSASITICTRMCMAVLRTETPEARGRCECDHLHRFSRTSARRAARCR